MTNNKALNQSGNINKFAIGPHSTNDAFDIGPLCVDFRYYENVLSNNVSATATIVDTGSMKKKGGIIDGLPIRGGERTDIILSDNLENELKFELYVNRLRNVNPETTKDTFFIDLASKEYFTNEQTRVTEKYSGKISDNVKNIVEKLLKSKIDKNNLDESSSKYNFYGNRKKPFYICTWLASKSYPGKGIGGAAGFLFYQTRDGFNFKSIDNIFKNKSRKKVLNIYFNQTQVIPPGYDQGILNYSIISDTELDKNLALGTYNNKSIFFDFFAMRYIEVDYNINKQKKETAIAGNKFNFVAKEFTQTPSRYMFHVLDVGVNSDGKNTEEQLKNTKNNPTEPNFDAANTMVQSIMRYNQLFTIKIDVVIAGNFSVKAGDLVYCGFPKMEGSNTKDINEESSGFYMVSSVCHRITPSDTYSSMSLVRDSYGIDRRES